MPEQDKRAHRLHDQLCPHQTIRAVLEKFLDGVLVLVSGHRTSLTDETNTKKAGMNFFSHFEIISNFQKSCKKCNRNTPVDPSPSFPNC